MTLNPKLYEGMEYVSHDITRVPLRRSPTNRWKIVLTTAVPIGGKNVPFEALLDLPTDATPHILAKELKKFIKGMKERWNKRTSTDDSFLSKLEEDLKAVVVDAY